MPLLRRDAALATAVVLVFILHGSLYPYDFHAPTGTRTALDALLESRHDGPDSLGEMAANVLLYFPLGLFGGLAVRGAPALRWVLLTLAGALLSVAMELLQFLDAGRVTSLWDVYLNTAGTALGAAASLALGAETRLPFLSRVTANPLPATLLLAMVGYRLFPYVPTTNLHKYWNALKPLLYGPGVSLDAFRYTAIWLTAGELLAAIFGRRGSALALPALLGAVLAGKVVIVGLALTRSELAGSAVALVAQLVLAGRLRTALVPAILFAAIILQRLEPFDFQPLPRPFGWMPFRGFLSGSIAVNSASFLEKLFLYGSLLWLLARAAWPPWAAALAVTGTLLATSVAETYLPGRSAEITDAAMSLLIAGAAALFDRGHRGIASPRGKVGVNELPRAPGVSPLPGTEGVAPGAAGETRHAKQEQ